MSQYLVNKFKGIYRILPDLTLNNDFPRNLDGTIDRDAGAYIKCQYGNKIYHYGGRIMTAYIPSVGRGRNIKKALKKQKIEIFDYDESDEEAMFHFNVADIEPVAELMRASSFGASISPWSSRNLPKNKDIIIPEEDMAKYKEVTKQVGKTDMLIIKKLNDEFMNEVLAKALRPKGKRKPYDYKSEMTKLRLSRQMKEYVYIKGLWQNYLDFLNDKIENYYKKRSENE